MDNRVFLSHSSKDKEAVRRLAEDLKRAGLDVWLDERKISVATPITEAIQEGLQNSKYLAVWLTRSAVESRWVATEWQAMFYEEISNGSKVVLPLLAEDCNIPLFLRGREWADFRQDYTHGLSDFLKAIGIKAWENKLGIKFAPIMPGTFLMGSNKVDPANKNNFASEKPVHEVTIERVFYISIYTITQAQWMAVMNTEPWKGIHRVREGDDYPAVNITWYDVQDFLNNLSSSCLD